MCGGLGDGGLWRENSPERSSRCKAAEAAVLLCVLGGNGTREGERGLQSTLERVCVRVLCVQAEAEQIGEEGQGNHRAGRGKGGQSAGIVLGRRGDVQWSDGRAGKMKRRQRPEERGVKAAWEPNHRQC